MKSYLLFAGIVVFTIGLTTGQPVQAADKADVCELALTKDVDPDWVADTLRKIEKKETAAQKKLRLKVAEDGFKSTAFNKALVKNHNDKYTMEVSRGVITNQQSSGRCWIFASLNIIRSRMIEQGRLPKNFQFSQSYLYFFSMLEKVNNYYESVLQTVERAESLGEVKGQVDLSRAGIQDGGEFNWFLFLINKYGLVPHDVMPDTESAINTDQLLQELTRYSGEATARIINASATMKKRAGKFTKADLAKLEDLKRKELELIVSVLRTHLGAPPVDGFTLNVNPKTNSLLGRNNDKVETTFTPQTFASEFVRFNADDYVTISSNPFFETEQSFMIKDSGLGQTHGGQRKFNMRYLNVGVDRMKQLIANSIDSGYAVYFVSDITKDASTSTGILHPGIFMGKDLYPLVPKSSKKGFDRVTSLFLGFTSRAHAMAITGYDRPDQRKPIVKYKVENSWGFQAGDRGVYHMYEAWFDKYVTDVVVPVGALSEQELALVKSRPVRIEGGFF